MSFLHLSGPLCPFPLSPLSDLLPLADGLWGSFCLLFRGPVPPPGPLVFLVLVCAFLALCSVLVFSWFLSCCGSSVGVFLFVFLPAILRLSSLWPLCAAFGVAGVSLFAVFVVLWGWLPSPAGCSLPPPSVVPLRRPGPVTVLVPPSVYLVASCDGPVALLFCLGRCGALFPRFILLHGSKGLWPCVGFCVTLYTMVLVLLLCTVLLR